MITKDCIETAYSFFHQKHRVYIHSTLDWQKDDIEVAIAQYADEMDAELFQLLAQGRKDFLHNHRLFGTELDEALTALEKML